MTETSNAPASPYGVYLAHCTRGELVYQVDENNRAIFHPRLVAPQTGGELGWRVSRGRGTVHATTVIHPREGNPYNLALIELDEGFRMMSRVEGVAPGKVSIDDRVHVDFTHGTDEHPHLPIFKPMVAQ